MVLFSLLLLLGIIVLLYIVYRHYIYQPKDVSGTMKKNEENFTFKL